MVILLNDAGLESFRVKEEKVILIIRVLDEPDLSFIFLNGVDISLENKARLVKRNAAVLHKNCRLTDGRRVLVNRYRVVHSKKLRRVYHK